MFIHIDINYTATLCIICIALRELFFQRLNLGYAIYTARADESETNDPLTTKHCLSFSRRNKACNIYLRIVILIKELICNFLGFQNTVLCEALPYPFKLLNRRIHSILREKVTLTKISRYPQEANSSISESVHCNVVYFNSTFLW